MRPTDPSTEAAKKGGHPTDPFVEAAEKGRFIAAEDTCRLKPGKRQSKQQIRGPPAGMGHNQGPPWLPPSGAGAMRAQTSVLALVRWPDSSFPLLPIRPLNSVRYTGMLLGDLGPTKIYELIKLGRLDARKLGSQTRITGESIRALIDALPKGVATSPQPEGRRLSERDRARAQARAEPKLNDLK